MTPAAIIQEIVRRGGTLRVENGRLLAFPAGLIDAALREAMKACRAELVEEVAACAAFPATVAREIGCYGHGGECFEDHVPMMPRPCRNPRLAGDSYCAEFTEEQLIGYTASHLAAAGRGCGDCLIAHARVKLDKMQAKREEEEQREIRTRRANKARYKD